MPVALPIAASTRFVQSAWFQIGFPVLLLAVSFVLDRWFGSRGGSQPPVSIEQYGHGAGDRVAIIDQSTRDTRIDNRTTIINESLDSRGGADGQDDNVVLFLLAAVIVIVVGAALFARAETVISLLLLVAGSAAISLSCLRRFRTPVDADTRRRVWTVRIFGAASVICSAVLSRPLLAMGDYSELLSDARSRALLDFSAFFDDGVGACLLFAQGLGAAVLIFCCLCALVALVLASPQQSGTGLIARAGATLPGMSNVWLAVLASVLAVVCCAGVPAWALERLNPATPRTSDVRISQKDDAAVARFDLSAPARVAVVVWFGRLRLGRAERELRPGRRAIAIDLGGDGSRLVPGRRYRVSIKASGVSGDTSPMVIKTLSAR